ncbi:hypothetical protein PIB30_076229 [Stylosanthes scabra]|uniref:Uncharacterized protein n=1 Tax=Stylosanthes scabra TaxID=79078 RepID=A0ABU6WNJ6_9FABA|nr:hypothetical protein [Stylosanthes scabra]
MEEKLKKNNQPIPLLLHLHRHHPPILSNPYRFRGPQHHCWIPSPTLQLFALNLLFLASICRKVCNSSLFRHSSLVSVGSDDVLISSAAKYAAAISKTLT